MLVIGSTLWVLYWVSIPAFEPSTITTARGAEPALLVHSTLHGRRCLAGYQDRQEAVESVDRHDQATLVEPTPLGEWRDLYRIAIVRAAKR